MTPGASPHGAQRLAAAPRVALALLFGATMLIGCAPRLGPLPGNVDPAMLPRAELPPGHHQVAFEWEYSDVDMVGRGEGVARIAFPDSVRLDFFLAGGLAGGGAVMIGDAVDAPGIELVRRLIPPPTLLWGSLGRTNLPVTRDTAIRRDGALLRADLGRPVAWRVTFRGDRLVRLEHVDGGRLVEWVDRAIDSRIEYRQEAAHRSLKLHITRVENVTPFDESIWHIDH
jgi:hypothetical protein